MKETTPMAFQSINPATEAVLATFDEFTPQQTEQALAEADAAFRAWRRVSFAERAGAMRRAADLLRERWPFSRPTFLPTPSATSVRGVTSSTTSSVNGAQPRAVFCTRSSAWRRGRVRT
jgi:hypothetical protein